MLSKKWLGSDTLRAMSEKYNALVDLLKGSDEVYQTTFARKLTKILPGNGLQGGGTLESDRTLSVKPADDGIISGASGIRLDLIQVLTSDSTTQAVSGRVAKTLNERIDAITSGGEVRKIRVAEVYSDMAYEGELPSGQVLIAVGKPLFRPKLFIDGTLIPKSWYTVDLVTGTITLSAPYSDAEELPTFKAKWNVLDEFEVAVKFSYPTLDALVASVDMKSRVNIGDIIQILGEVEAFDGGDRKVKCEATEGLNGVNIGTVETPKWLNEVPNSRPELLRALIDANKSDILSVENDRWKLFTNRGIAPNTNLNNVVESGVYELLEDVSNTLLNMPEPLQGLNQPHTLIVTQNGEYFRQTILSYGRITFYRSYVYRNGGKEWNLWSEGLDTGNCPMSKSANGWVKFANGLIIQWGNLDITTSLAITINLPISYTSTFKIFTSAYDFTKGLIHAAPTGVSTAQVNQQNNSTGQPRVSWFTIGY